MFTYTYTCFFHPEPNDESGANVDASVSRNGDNRYLLSLFSLLYMQTCAHVYAHILITCRKCGEKTDNNSMKLLNDSCVNLLVYDS